jgi:hypothetical protein
VTTPTREIGHAAGSSAGGWWDPPGDEETPELRWPNSVRVYDNMRRQDAQVASVLRAVSMPVQRTRWSIDPAGARDEVVAQVAEDLGLPVKGDPSGLDGRARTRDRFSWAHHLEQAMLDLAYGHMFFEQVYRIDAAGRARLRKLAPRMPRTICAINVAPDGGLISIEQHPPVASSPYPLLTGLGPSRRLLTPTGTLEIPVGRLVAYTHQREGGDWTGRSLLRPAYKHWLLKDRLLRTQAETIDRNGMGIPVYTAAQGEATLAAGEALAKSIRAGDDSGAALPFGAELALKGVEGSLPDANPAIRYHDEQIARAVLAHFLNLGSQTGSWALGSTFADFFTSSLQGVAELHRDTAQQHVVEDLVDVNWGEDEPAPRLVFEEIGSRQQATAQALKFLSDAGILLPDKSLEEAARQLYDLPPKDPIRLPAAPAPAPEAIP